MANFVEYDGTWYNVDNISAMSFDDNRFTHVYFGGNIESPVVFNGDVRHVFLNKNNDVTMKDKNTANYSLNKLKFTMSDMLARLDAIKRAVETIAKGVK